MVLATFHVNTFADTVAVNLKTGRDSRTNHVSLRTRRSSRQTRQSEFIRHDSTSRRHIQFDDRPHRQRRSDLRGDLDILVASKLTIKGSTHGGQTIINGNNLDRVFLTESGNVSISNVVIEHGQS